MLLEGAWNDTEFWLEDCVNETLHGQKCIDNDTYSLIWPNGTETNRTNQSATQPKSMYYPFLKQSNHVVVIYAFAYMVIFLLAVIGNSLVVIVVYRSRRMHTGINYFIVNLAVADLLVSLFCLPITLLDNLFSGWRFGSLTCKLVPFLQAVAIGASVMTLAIISLDRYLAICQRGSLKMSRAMAKIVIAGVWAFSNLVMLPWLIKYRLLEMDIGAQKIPMCVELWENLDQQRTYFLVIIFFVLYVVPLAFITVCYGLIGHRVWRRYIPDKILENTSQCVIRKSKVKVVKMLVVVVIVFALSYLPLYSIHLVLIFDVVSQKSSAFSTLSNIIFPLAQWLALANSCVNPVIYSFFSKNYRKGFKDFLQTCVIRMCCLKRRRHIEEARRYSNDHLNGQYPNQQPTSSSSTSGLTRRRTGPEEICIGPCVTLSTKALVQVELQITSI